MPELLTQAVRESHGVGDFMRLLSCATLTRTYTVASPAALALFVERYPHALHAGDMRKALVDVQAKAAIGPGSTTDPTWALPLVARPLVDPLLALVQKESLLGRIVGLRRAPFNVKVPRQTATGAYAWVAENLPIPVTKFAFANVTLAQGKIAGTVVLTAELVKLSAPNSVTAMSDALVGGAVLFQDSQFLDPAITEIANARPASITNGLTPIASTGDLAKDVDSLLAALYATSPNVQKPTLVMSPAHAGQLASQLKITTPTLTIGLAPVVTSVGAGPHVVALDAAMVVYADGGIEVDVTDEATVEMADNPAAPTAATVPTSLWQLNLAGIKVVRMLWWSAAPGSVQLLTVTP